MDKNPSASRGVINDYGLDVDLETVRSEKRRTYLRLFDDCTACHGYEVYYALKKFSLEDFFDTVVCSEDVEHSKPHPEAFLTTVKKLGINPNNCVVIEDSPRGVTAAKRAGMKCIAIPHALADFEFHNADYKVAFKGDFSSAD